MALLLSFILMLSSCNGTINKLEGEWFMCKSEYNGTIKSSAVCAKVEFAQDNQGKITFANGEFTSFTYFLISDSTIEFSFKDYPISINKEDKMEYLFYPFNEKRYSYKISEEDKFENLEIFSVDKRSRYFLSR